MRKAGLSFKHLTQINNFFGIFHMESHVCLLLKVLNPFTLRKLKGLFVLFWIDVRIHAVQ